MLQACQTRPRTRHGVAGLGCWLVRTSDAAVTGQEPGAPTVIHGIRCTTTATWNQLVRAAGFCPVEADTSTARTVGSLPARASWTGQANPRMASSPTKAPTCY